MDEVKTFLDQYPTKTVQTALALCRQLKLLLPGITEQLDLSAKMVAYMYGPRYTDIICCIFPSKKGVKLSFYKGTELPDPQQLLKGAARTTRYLEINDQNLEDIKPFLKEATKMYRLRREA